MSCQAAPSARPYRPLLPTLVLAVALSLAPVLPGQAQARDTEAGPAQTGGLQGQIPALTSPPGEIEDVVRQTMRQRYDSLQERLRPLSGQHTLEVFSSDMPGEAGEEGQAGPAGAEWRAEDGSWSDVPADGAIEGLAPGAYEVRMKEGPNHEASEVTTVEVASFSATHGGLIYPDGTTENEDGEVVLPIGGGTVTFPDGTEVALPGGSAVDPDAPSVTAPDGTVMAPDGEGSLTVTFPNGAAAVVPSGSEVSDEGVLTTPDGRELRQEYTVTFDDCLDSTENQTAVVAHGSAVARPADPALDGWRFLGWYSDAALTQEWDFASPVTSDMTLYASWEKVEGSSGGSLEGTGLAGTGDPAALVAPLALAVTGAGALWASRRRS